MTSQLRKDLEHQIDRKLQRWLLDSTELYKMADLPGRYAFEDIFCSLLSTIGRMAYLAKVDTETVKTGLDTATQFWRSKEGESS
jgi:hypothetical protein